MTGKQLKAELEKYKRQYKILVGRCEQLDNENADLKAKLTMMAKNLTNAQNAFDANKALLRQMGEEHNKKEQDLIEFMNKLKAKLRELGYNGNFDRLGQ